MDGESDGYTAFFQRQYPRVVAMLIAYRGFTPEIAEDAAAEAMTRLLLHWRKVSMPQAWVRTVALRHACLLKGKQQAAVLPDREIVDQRAVDDLAAVELALIAGSAVAALPPRQREVMTLTLVDMTPSEIADVLGCTPEQARGNLAHARRAVSSAIQKEAGDGPDTQRPR
ncbi:sigma-70 family RNA polymerase sigma factor [Streptomyces sp. NPDC007095]|uniref:RNA polymerase sigma factor n=1 Tax=Streptomyces sp. NPDC007095 TaxID=3154482 RepID=UPI00340D04BF